MPASFSTTWSAIVVSPCSVCSASRTLGSGARANSRASRARPSSVVTGSCAVSVMKTPSIGAERGLSFLAFGVYAGQDHARGQIVTCRHREDGVIRVTPTSAYPEFAPRFRSVPVARSNEGHALGLRQRRGDRQSAHRAGSLVDQAWTVADLEIAVLASVADIEHQQQERSFILPRQPAVDPEIRGVQGRFDGRDGLIQGHGGRTLTGSTAVPVDVATGGRA